MQRNTSLSKFFCSCIGVVAVVWSLKFFWALGQQARPGFFCFSLVLASGCRSSFRKAKAGALWRCVGVYWGYWGATQRNGMENFRWNADLSTKLRQGYIFNRTKKHYLTGCNANSNILMTVLANDTYSSIHSNFTERLHRLYADKYTPVSVTHANPPHAIATQNKLRGDAWGDVWGWICVGEWDRGVLVIKL